MNDLKSEFIKMNAKNLHEGKARKSCEAWLKKAIGLNISMQNESNQAIRINGDDDVYNLSGYIAGQISLVRQPQVRDYLWGLFSRANQYYQDDDLKKAYIGLHHISWLVHHLVYLPPLDEKLWLVSRWWKLGKDTSRFINVHDNHLLKSYFSINTLSIVYWHHYSEDKWRDLLDFELDYDSSEDLLPKGVKSQLCSINSAMNEFMNNSMSSQSLREASSIYTGSSEESGFYYHVISRAIHKSSHYMLSRGYMTAMWLWNRKNAKQASHFTSSNEYSWFIRGAVTLMLKSIMIINRARQNGNSSFKPARMLIQKLYSK